MIHQKGFAPVLVILLIAAAIGGYLIYSNYSNNRTKPVQQSTLQPSPAFDETVSWETYTDRKFVFFLLNIQKS